MVQIIESDPFEEQKFIVTDDDLAEFRRKLYKELERQKGEFIFYLNLIYMGCKMLTIQHCKIANLWPVSPSIS